MKEKAYSLKKRRKIVEEISYEKSISKRPYLRKITAARLEAAKTIPAMIVAIKINRSPPLLVLRKDPPSEPSALPMSPFDR